jgi:hypothetical protein
LIAYNLGTKPSHYGAVLLTCVLLVALLGLNVSIIGFVDIPSSSIILVAEFYLLIFLLDAVFAGSYLLIGRNRFRQPEH